MRFRFPHKFVIGVGLIAISVFVLTRVFFVSGAQGGQRGQREQGSQKSSPKQLNDKQVVNQTVSDSFNEQEPSQKLTCSALTEHAESTQNQNHQTTHTSKRLMSRVCIFGLRT